MEDERAPFLEWTRNGGKGLKTNAGAKGGQKRTKDSQRTRDKGERKKHHSDGFWAQLSLCGD